MRALVIVLALCFAAQGASAEVKEGDRAAAIRSGKTKSGKPVTWASLRGKVVVLTFGASWCRPCRKELPALDKIAIELIRKEKRQVRFVAVNLDDEQSAGEAFMRRLKLDCIIAIFDPSGRIGANFKPPRMPSTYIVDGKGIVRHLHEGYEKGDEKKLAAKVRALLR